MSRKYQNAKSVFSMYFLVLIVAAAVASYLYDGAPLINRITTVIAPILSFIVTELAYHHGKMKQETFGRLEIICLHACMTLLGSLTGKGSVWIYLVLVELIFVRLFEDISLFWTVVVCMAVTTLGYQIVYQLGLAYVAYESSDLFGAAAVAIMFFTCISVIRFLNKKERRAKEAENSLEDLMKILTSKCHEARKATRSKSIFLSNMSHEIRTPINSILGMNELILRENKDPEIREYAESIDSSSRMLLALVNDVLDFSKIESGRMELLDVEYRLQEVLTDVVNVIRPKLQEKALALILEIDENLPTVLRGDDVRLRQILTNLLSNAVKYTDNGTVTLRMSGPITGNVLCLHVEVEDTGKGIREEDRVKLFEEFQRLDEEQNRFIEGTGLGMSITTQLLQLMDSRLTVKSELGLGSNFIFTVRQKVVDVKPIGNIQNSLTRELKKIRQKAVLYAPKARVLVVDDNDMNRKVFRQLLKRTAIMVEDVNSGKACLDLIKKQPFDLIFMDHMMPEMDGIQALHHIREMESLCKEVPVVALTANAVSGAKEMYLSEGFSAFLAKPIMPDKLEQMLMKLLPPELLEEKSANEDGEADSSAVNLSSVKASSDGKSMIDDLPMIDGIDWDFAALHFTDREMLDYTLENFYKSLEMDASKLQEFYMHLEEADGLEQYRIKVHSMKSASALVGILPLSGCAKILENAAAEGDRELIFSMHESFVKVWRSYKEKLSVLYPKEMQESVAFDKEAVITVLTELTEAAEGLDVDVMDNCVERLMQMELPESIRGLAESLQAAVTGLDTDAVTELAEKIQSCL